MVRYVVVVVHGARGLRKGVTVGAQHPFAHIGLGDAGHATWPNVTDGANPGTGIPQNTQAEAFAPHAAHLHTTRGFMAPLVDTQHSPQ